MVQELKTKAGRTLVGLTGTFGSGKSTAARFFEPLGAEVLDADRIAHEALLEGSAVYPALTKRFPEALGTGGMDRVKLAACVFSDGEARKELESIIHPYVFQRLAAEIAEADARVIVLEIPLLFETGFDRSCDVCVVVQAPQDIIEKRLAERGFGPEEIRRRQKAQMSPEEKLKRAAYVIDNSGDLEGVRKQVEKIWKTLNNASKGDVSHYA
ncbi:MAG: dephospho-CoA kinase [Candidatus Omnitrophica bacterium]|nr:dephospho-CoA kinase [Candidatus Omnitrophota bacterium]